MERRRAAGALLALAACILCTAAAPTASNHTALDIYDGQPEGCYYNFQHYGEGDRIMTNEPCLNCTCHNRMLMCYLRVCPFTKPIGQDCTVEKRADQCCPIVTCPDVPVDLLTLTSTTSPAEYGATGLGKLDKYGCSINGKYFPEGSKVPPSPNKPCEHCYCIRNMTTCVMQECTLHVDGCTPIYHKDVCCPVRYSCDHPEDEILLLDDKTTTVRPTPGYLLTTTTLSPVTQLSQDCVHEEQIYSDGAFIKTEKSCEHCYCMKGDIVCVVQDCGTPMENEGKNCTALPPREGQCCPDTYICEGDELNTEYTTEITSETVVEDLTTLSPPRRVGVEGSGYRKEPDNIPYTEKYPTHHEHEGSGDAHEAGQTMDINDVYTTEENIKHTYTTIPADIVSIEQDKSPQPPHTTDDNILEDHIKSTTISEKEQEITHPDFDKAQATTTSIPSYDHKLELPQPEDQTVTEKQIDIPFTTITPTQEEKEITTVKTPTENIVTDAVGNEEEKYFTTTVAAILEDEGITTESDREQQPVSIETVEVHSYQPGQHGASTTSAPFLEEVEGISSSTYGQHLVTDGIAETDIYDPSINKDDFTTFSAPEVTESVLNMDKDKHESTEPAEQPSQEGHDYIPSSTNIPALDVFEKTTKVIPEDLTTSKSSEEIYDDDKLISTSTSKSVSEQNEETFTEKLRETSTSSESLTTIISLIESGSESNKEHTEKYDLATEQKVDDIDADISSTSSIPTFESNDDLATKISEEPASIPIEAVTTEITNKDSYETSTISAPVQEDHLTTMVDKDTIEPQKENEGLTKPEDSKTATTQEIQHDFTTDKIMHQQDYETQKSTTAPISEEVEITTTEFIRDQDYVTSGPLDQESLKPADYGSSTSSTPFLEEIEKLTTETSHGYVVTDIITEKQDSKLPGHESTVSETLPSGEADTTTSEPDKGLNTIPSDMSEEKESSDIPAIEKTTQAGEIYVTHTYDDLHDKEVEVPTASVPSQTDSSIIKEDKIDFTTEPWSRKENEPNVDSEDTKQPESVTQATYDSYPSTASIGLQETKSTPTEPSELQEKSPNPQPTYENTQEENVSSGEPTTEISSESSNIPDEIKPEKEVKPEIDEHVASSTQIAPSLSEDTTVNLLENEINEDNLVSPGRIPGEGDCLLNGITYRNESLVPSTNKCHTDCRCVSSIIKCNPIICSPPPEYMDNCQPTYDSPDSCCPSYVCDQFRETLPPMPHVHITTEIPQQTPIDCRGDQCEIHDDKKQTDTTDKKTEDTHTSSTPESCADGKCTPTSADCVNGECKYPQVIDTSVVQCEGEKCETSSEALPQSPICKYGENCEGHKVPEALPTSCKEGDNCKGTEENVQDCTGEECRRKVTPDIEAKPSSCTGIDCEKKTKVETTTSSEGSDIKADTPELQENDKETIHETIAPEKQDAITEIIDLGTTSVEQLTEAAVTKIPEYSITQEDSSLPQTSSMEKESVTETITKLPKLEDDNDIIPTKIDYSVTEGHQISTDIPEKQTFETKIPEDYATTETSKYPPDVEENTIQIITDEEITTKQPTEVELDNTVSATSEPEIYDDKKYTTVLPEKEGITDLIEPQVTESQEHITSPELSVTKVDYHTDVPAFTASKPEEETKIPNGEIEQDITTEYYSSVPKVTTLATSEIAEEVTEVQKDDNAIYTSSHESATEPQSISSDTLPVSSEGSLGDEENSLSTKATDEVTEANIASLETDYTKKPEIQETPGNKLTDAPINYITDFTTDTSIKDHEVHTEHELPSSVPDKDTTSNVQKDAKTTQSPADIIEDTPVVTLSEQDESESASPVTEKTEDKIPTVTQYSDSVTTEPSDLLASTELGRDTEKPEDTENEITQTEKLETPTHEHVTEVSVEQDTMPEKEIEQPEILSHKKEQSSESPISDIEKKTTISIEDAEDSKQDTPSTEKSITSDTAEQQPESGIEQSVPEASEIPIKKDETSDKEEEIVSTRKPTIEHEEIATTYVGDLEKSTEIGGTVTDLPLSHETEVAFIPVTQEQDEGSVSGSPEMIPVTDKHDEDVKVDMVETSTDNMMSVHVSSVPYEPEQTEMGLSDFTTKYYEAIATEKVQEITITPISSPEIPEIITEAPQHPSKEEDGLHTEIPVDHETAPIRDDAVTTLVPEKHTEEDLDTKIHKEVATEKVELMTEIPVLHSTSSDQFPTVPETLVTEAEDTSKVSDEVTEYQKPITPTDDSFATEQPEIKEPIKQTEEQVPIIDSQDKINVSPSVEGQTELTELKDTIEEALTSVAIDYNKSSTTSAVTELDAIDETQHSNERTTVPESSDSVDVTQHPYEKITIPESSDKLSDDVTEYPHEKITVQDSSEPLDVTEHPHDKTTLPESTKSDVKDVTEYPYERTTIAESSDLQDATEHPHDKMTLPESSESQEVTEHPHERTTLPESSKPQDATEHSHERTTLPESSEPQDVTEHPHERTTLPQSSEPQDVTELPHEKATLSESSEPLDETKQPHERTTQPESSSITTSSPQDFNELGNAQTVSSEPLTDAPSQSTQRIPDFSKPEHTVTEALETLAPESKPSDESYTVKDEKTTETTQDYGITTELQPQPASESDGTSELPGTTSAPAHELPETTPYLIELQEHTHKIQQDVTTSQIEEEGTTERIVSDDIEHQHPELQATTEMILDQQTEIKEPTKHHEETSTPLDVLEKTTQVPISKVEESLPTTYPADTEIKDTTQYKDKDITTSSPAQSTEIDKIPAPETHVADLDKTITTSEKPIQSDIPVEITTPEEVAVLSTEKATTIKADELPTQAPAFDKHTKPQEKPSDLPSHDLSKPAPSNIQPTDELPTPDEDAHFPPSGSSGYGNEPDYVEEDQAFGPGTCRYGGKVYVSAQQIPRDDPCDFCFCFRSDIICLQQSCPPPIHGCHEEPIQGFCCPRYECPVSMATTLNVTTTTTTTTTTLPPHFPTHSYKGAAQRRGCQIKGHTYKVGEVVRGSSGPCLHCTCGGDGQMKCDPKACTPEPMLRQMIAAAVSAKRRR